jgi:hypothetical protein
MSAPACILLGFALWLVLAMPLAVIVGKWIKGGGR